MNGSEIWNIARWAIGCYLIGLGCYSLVTARMPRRRRPRWSYPFSAGREHRGTTAVVLALVCIGAGLLVILAGP
jgi:hypothetical protein